MSSAFVHRNTYFLRLTSSLTRTSLCGCMSGSPPAIDTIGAPHSSMAASACSTGIRCLSTEAGSWILPQPAHARLQANSGSSSTISGNLSLRASFWLMRYIPIRRLWRSGIDTWAPAFSSVTSCLVSYRRSCCQPQFLRQPELDGLRCHDDFLRLDLAEPGQRLDDLPDHGGRRRGAGRDPDRRHPGEPAEFDILRPVDQVGRRPGPLGRLHQAQ